MILSIELGLVFVPLLAAMNPLGKIPVFISLTEGATPQRVRRVVHQAVGVSLGISVIFLFAGRYIFEFLSIRSADFEIGGGLLLFIIAVADILNVRRRLPQDDEVLGVCPLATPLIAGPALLTTILLMADSYGVATTLVGLVLNTAIIWGVLRSASWLVRKIGRPTLVGLSKVMMILLAAIGVMMVRKGLMSCIADAAAAAQT